LATFFHGHSYASILIKIFWATLWAIFSQTNLVTLVYGKTNSKIVRLAGKVRLFLTQICVSVRHPDFFHVNATSIITFMV
jgi:hypothetical protein